LQAPPNARVIRMKAGTVYLPGLKRAREQSRLSIRELAKKADLVPDTVWQLETMNRAATQKTRRKLADALGVGIRELRRMEDGET